MTRITTPTVAFLELVALVVLPVAVSVVGCDRAPPPDHESEIRRLYETYQEARLHGQGRDAAACLSGESLEYFAEVARLARDGAADTVQARPLVDRVLVLTLRLLVSPEELATLDGSRSFAATVDRDRSLGGGSPEGGSRESGGENAPWLGPVEVNGDVATAVEILDGQLTGSEVSFRREDGRWRLDLTPALDGSSAQIRALWRRAAPELDENQYLLQVVGDRTGKPVPKSIWDPRSSRPPPQE